VFVLFGDKRRIPLKEELITYDCSILCFDSLGEIYITLSLNLGKIGADESVAIIELFN
jgi:hypothetical protein